MAAPTSPSRTAPDSSQSSPTLENGDRLTRPEFERRYEAMPFLKKAELIEGVVYMPSPVRQPEHSGPHFNMIAWLGHYLMFTPGVEGGDNATLRLDLDNEPQPDAFLMIASRHGGQARVDDEGYVAGAPELIAEVAASSVSYDLGDKRNVYRRSGVREYVVWRVLDRAIDWFILRDGRYETLLPHGNGVYKSEVFPGLWLNVDALLRGDLPAVGETVREGVATAAHAAFLNRLGYKPGGKDSGAAELGEGNEP
jgi:Uma2 family endonuclease